MQHGIEASSTINCSTAHVVVTIPTTLQVLHPSFSSIPLWQVAPPHGQQLRKQSAATVRPPRFRCRISGSVRDPISAFCNISLRPRNWSCFIKKRYMKSFEPFISISKLLFIGAVAKGLCCPWFTLHRFPWLITLAAKVRNASVPWLQTLWRGNYLWGVPGGSWHLVKGGDSRGNILRSWAAGSFFQTLSDDPYTSHLQCSVQSHLCTVPVPYIYIYIYIYLMTIAYQDGSTG